MGIMASAIEKVIEIAANNLFDNASVQSCLTAVTDLSNNLNTRVNAVIDGAPSVLNTLNELAAALGDDANFATTVTGNTQTAITSIGTLTSLVVSGDLSGNDASFNVVDIHTLNLTTALSASGVGLGNVDNTTDAGKPVSTAQQTALDLKANSEAPTFTGKVTTGDVSGNDASFNVVDIHTLNLTTALS